VARILVVTQGALAQELAQGAQVISGRSDRIETLSLAWDESPAVSEERLGAALEASGGINGGVLILTDIPGGTPFNVAGKFAAPGKVEVISGVNLAMVVRLCCPGCRERSVEELALWLLEKGRQSIRRYHANGSLESDVECG